MGAVRGAGGGAGAGLRGGSWAGAAGAGAGVAGPGAAVGAGATGAGTVAGCGFCVAGLGAGAWVTAFLALSRDFHMRKCLCEQQLPYVPEVARSLHGSLQPSSLHTGAGAVGAAMGAVGWLGLGPTAGTCCGTVRVVFPRAEPCSQQYRKNSPGAPYLRGLQRRPQPTTGHTGAAVACWRAAALPAFGL